MRAGGAWLALAAALVLAPTAALAAPRSVEVVWRYPTGGAAYTGIALYHAESRAEIDAGANLTRVDLGLPAADDAGVARVAVMFDDQRDYYLVLRVYDSAGRESPNSAVGAVPASAPSGSGPPLDEGFESYRGGQDPDDWEDTASGSTQLGDAALFATVELADGTIAFGTSSAEADIHSHFLTSVARDWASYELSGRIASQTLDGEAGVTVLSQFPAALAYYRLARSGAGPFGVSLRGGGTLACEASASTGVSAEPGAWLRFRVRVTRFDGRNRIRAMMYADGATAPSAWQVDCWDPNPTTTDSGAVGVYASGAPGTWWDDLRVVSVAGDGAPPGYRPPPPLPPPPTTDTYTSRASLVHWWMPGRDGNAPGRDFATRSTPIDAATAAKGIGRRDFFERGTTGGYVSLDGKSESLGTASEASYGFGNTWSLATWVRPDAMVKKKKPRYVVDLNGELSTRSENRISLMLDPSSRFAIEISDPSGRTRALVAAQPIDANAVGRRWYHVAVVKSGVSSLTLYVDGQAVASTDVGVPLQTNGPRVMRVGTRVSKGKGHGFNGGIHSIALWSTALRAGEVRALFTNNRGYDLH